MKLSRVFVLLTLVSIGCKPVFNAGGFPNTEALYTAAMREYNAKRYENAVHAFERLTIQQVAGRGTARAMQRHDVGHGEQRRE